MNRTRLFAVQHRLAAPAGARTALSAGFSSNNNLRTTLSALRECRGSRRVLVALAALHCWLIAAAGLAQVPSESPGPGAETNAAIEAQTVDAADVNDQAVAESEPQGVRHDALIGIGKFVELKAGDSAEAVVVIGGSTRVQGRVRDAVVAIFGDVEIAGGDGTPDVVAILGNVKLGPDARVGELVCIGGELDIAEGAVVSRGVTGIDLGSFGLEGLRPWLVQCVLKMRPLAPQVGWVWIAYGICVLVYLLVAVLFPRPVEVSAKELAARPATTFFAGLLVKILIPVVLIILAATGIGLVVVPFLVAAVIFAFVIGKVAILEYLGGKIGGSFGMNMMTKPLVAFLIGTAVVTLFYMVPVVGLITFGIISIWGFGATITALFTNVRREKPSRPALPPSSGSTASEPPVHPAGTMAMTGAQPSGQGASERSESGEAPVARLPMVLSCPRAGFWERMGAAFLDLVLISIPAILVGPPLGFLVVLAYFAGMWAWKGTTVGGIVLRLQIVRNDGEPVTFLVALVRGLSAAFSALVLFLGFIWIAWDPNKESWHDKIAGTAVVRLPGSVPLVCL